jgi:hypothetical protein
MPYLPDILRDVVARVSTVTEADPDDPFAVYFNHGLQMDVGKEVYKKTSSGDDAYPLIWLVMPFSEDVGRDPNISASGRYELIIATRTDPNYTQAERDTISFKPRLFPIYELLMQELKKEKRLSNPYKIEHGRIILPYWGGGDVNGTNTENLFKNNIDAIRITGILMTIKQNC